jgi:hypothetical protein
MLPYCLGSSVAVHVVCTAVAILVLRRRNFSA